MTEARVQRGMYFEEFQPGYRVMTSARTVTEADIVAFAALSGDWNPIHVDAEYASTTAFGERVAHGLLGLSIATGLAVRMGFMDDTIIAFRSMDWKFSAPIKIGDTIHATVQVAETQALPRLGGGQIVFNVEILNQRDVAVQRGAWAMLVRSRPAA
jgi:acyl dehydratase